ncbi:MAG: glycosyltransferase family 2 protein [Deltaproteobacteria bacterium]|nr:glycosyltransferase family 2 protein [Deltaproteobacteria bacterium]
MFGPVPLYVQHALTFVSGGLLALALLPTLYLAFLALLAGRHRPVLTTSRTTRFAFVVPAHNEETGIGSTVASLLAVDWPRELVDIIVVADNCSDGTAVVARAAGATVLVRENKELRGKGYALELGFAHVLKETRADAVVVVDADTIASHNLLVCFATRIAAGAMAMQAEYGVRNLTASWRTELMALALAMFHTLRSNARERLSLSTGLRGNGMCFTRACLEQYPQKSFGLVEDVEQGLALGRGGVRIVAVFDAHVLGEMVSGGKASESQRRRWEDGRQKLKTEVLPGVLRDAVKMRSIMLLDLAMDLLVPPLSTIAVLVVVGVFAEGVRAVVLGPDLQTAIAWAPSLLLGLYIVRGMQLSGLGFRSVVVLFKAPAYIAWKILLKLKGAPKPSQSGQGEWVRTARETEEPKA